MRKVFAVTNRGSKINVKSADMRVQLCQRELRIEKFFLLLSEKKKISRDVTFKGVKIRKLLRFCHL